MSSRKGEGGKRCAQDGIERFTLRQLPYSAAEIAVFPIREQAPNRFQRPIDFIDQASSLTAIDGYLGNGVGVLEAEFVPSLSIYINLPTFPIEIIRKVSNTGTKTRLSVRVTYYE